MKRFSSRSAAIATLTFFSLSASTLLTGCFEKDGKKGSCSPTGGTCSTAATVVDLSSTTGCGLALQLADGTYVVPTGSTWTNFHATTGEKVLVGYTIKKNDGDADDVNTCSAGPLVELGCISVNTTTTTGAN
ncbi:hypothetical protein GCM10023172_01350 [Hymenobacter ginsengisoli]|uniref:Uncharacterized protein n=1 Tax=Hymenobacter ginsengisoli TaxID=1051626 RepID=A0ABP8PWJ9_9BACT|nr:MULTISPECIES: hypothetical protein [unclassified Hymenobacter]MBO2033530.1 hypothetical protein [Hymenobacter sp. BT559]